MNREKAVASVAVMAILASLFFVYESLKLPPPMMKAAPSSSLFPLIELGACILFAALMLKDSLAKIKSCTVKIDFHGKAVLKHVVILMLYLLSMPYLGYIISSSAYLLATLLQKSSNRLRSVAIAIGVVAALYIVFDVILHVSLPPLQLPGSE